MHQQVFIGCLIIAVAAAAIECESQTSSSSVDKSYESIQGGNQRRNPEAQNRLVREFSVALSRISAAKDGSNDEDSAARNLEVLASQIDLNLVDDKTVSEWVGELLRLLDRRFSYARLVTISVISDTGPRAHSALPRLYRMLEIDEGKSCMDVTATLEAVYLRMAIPRIGGEDLSPMICDGGKPFHFSDIHKK
jgi:hypothetical protein